MVHENPLTHFYPILAASKDVRLALRPDFGDFTDRILPLLREGEELPDEFTDVHAILHDLVHIDARCLDSTSVEGSEAGDYEIKVMEFAGVYFVEAPQFDTMGYFETKDEANMAIGMNW